MFVSSKVKILRETQTLVNPLEISLSLPLSDPSLVTTAALLE